MFSPQQESVGSLNPLDPSTKQISYNPQYEEMFSPEVSFCPGIPRLATLQMKKDDPRPCIQSRVMVSSILGLKLGSSGFCWRHMGKNTYKMRISVAPTLLDLCRSLFEHVTDLCLNSGLWSPWKNWTKCKTFWTIAYVSSCFFWYWIWQPSNWFRFSVIQVDKLAKRYKQYDLVNKVLVSNQLLPKDYNYIVAMCSCRQEIFCFVDMFCIEPKTLPFKLSPVD